MGSLTDHQKRGLALSVTLVVHLILVRLTWRDLRDRPDAGIRGPRRVWRLAAALNTTGSVAYWLFGRRRLRPPEPA